MRERSETAVLTAVEEFEARAGLFTCQERSRKQFSPLCRSCEARASLFRSQERSKKQFSPPLGSCEARIILLRATCLTLEIKKFCPSCVRLPVIASVHFPLFSPHLKFFYSYNLVKVRETSDKDVLTAEKVY